MAMKIQRYKHDAEVSYTLGATLTFELIKCASGRITRVFVSPEARDEGGIHELIEKCRQLRIPIIESEKAFNILSPKGNCFVIAEFRKEAGTIRQGNHLVFVNPSDAGNLGTILRTATGFGLTDIAIIRPAVDFYDPRVIRATMGAAFHVNVEYFDSIETYRERFPDNRLYAFMLQASRPLPEVVQSKEEPFSLVFGNEATGLPDIYAELCSAVIIKHSRDIDSLNLPMAAGIAMYEFTKEQWNRE
ncbi:MAG: TrmH family RNA methyltransferase [Lachnospiraceae bacterium]|nr:TrmH family RNA methyltransferase [Lachnospiraceae bacterium]